MVYVIELIIGCDDGNVIGLRFREIAGRVFMDECFRKSFNFRTTVLALGDNFLATAGENKVCLFSKIKGHFIHFETFSNDDEVKEVVTALEFVPKTNLLMVGYDNGDIKIIEKLLVKNVWDKDIGHNGHRITSMTAHVSGKIALTFSASSGVLKMWDVEKRNLAHMIDFKSPDFKDIKKIYLATDAVEFNENCEVKFSPSGKVYAISSVSCILVIGSYTGKTVFIHQIGQMFNNFSWLDLEFRLLVSMHNGSVKIFSSILQDTDLDLIKTTARKLNTKVYCVNKDIVVTKANGDLEIFKLQDDCIEEYCKYNVVSGRINCAAILDSFDGNGYFHIPADGSPKYEVVYRL